MNAKELIAILQKEDPNTEIVLNTKGDDYTDIMTQHIMLNLNVSKYDYYYPIREELADDPDYIKNFTKCLLIY